MIERLSAFAADVAIERDFIPQLAGGSSFISSDSLQALHWQKYKAIVILMLLKGRILLAGSNFDPATLL